MTQDPSPAEPSEAEVEVVAERALEGRLRDLRAELRGRYEILIFLDPVPLSFSLSFPFPFPLLLLLLLPLLLAFA